MAMKKPLKRQKLRNAEYYDFQPVLDKLYEQSKQGESFGSLLDIILERENILLAYQNIRKNKGSKTAGTDKKSIEYLSAFTGDNLVKYVRKRLEHYIPQSVRRVEIAKDNGKTRPLGIPTIADRLIQQCILQILEPICEAKFHERSNGFRPNRSAENALAQSYAMVQQQGLHFVVDVDIKGFFDNVNHGKLLRQMWSMGIRDKRLISILSAMLKAEVAGIGFPERGTPQGGIISPLLSNIVLNELDWWVASQWEMFPARLKREYIRSDNGVLDKSGKYKMLRAKSNLKECYIVRYADDFKIFCRKREDAEKLFIATKLWLKERLGLEISPEKSKVVNLKKKYSDFLGIRLKAIKKGKKKNGQDKYTVCSHVSSKAMSRIQAKTRQFIKNIQRPHDQNEEYRAISAYNAYIMGIHSYYHFATHISKDFRKIALGITRMLQNRLRERLKKKGLECSKYIAERYGKSGQLRFVNGQALVPLGYVQTKPPLFKRRTVNKYTIAGRASIHNNLERVNLSILYYLMRNPVEFSTIEYNSNRLSLYCAQRGKCSITGLPLEVDNIYCHHKKPRSQGGTDAYSNLVLLLEEIHILVHATDETVIGRILKQFSLTINQRSKLNTLRKRANLLSVT